MLNDPTITRQEYTYIYKIHKPIRRKVPNPHLLKYKETNHFGQETLCVFEAKIQVLSEINQKSPTGPKMAPNGQKHVILIILDHFGPS